MKPISAAKAAAIRTQKTPAETFGETRKKPVQLLFFLTSCWVDRLAVTEQSVNVTRGHDGSVGLYTQYYHGWNVDD